MSRRSKLMARKQREREALAAPRPDPGEAGQARKFSWLPGDVWIDPAPVDPEEVKREVGR